MSDYEQDSSSDSEIDEPFSKVVGKGKLVKKRKEEEPEDSDDEVSIHSDDDENDDDDLEGENSDMNSEADLDDLAEIGKRDGNAFHSSFMNMEYEEEEEDGDYLQRFDEEIKEDTIAKYHPELQMHNYNEVMALSRVVKDENGKIVDPLHKTIPILTKYERARILGERAKQLNAGAEPFISVEPEIIDGYLIAQKELEQKKIPFILKRPLPDGGCEYWKLKDLEIL
jgi:DNA-directed RNA polymerase I, II, and III subunit RPABC2